MNRLAEEERKEGKKEKRGKKRVREGQTSLNV